MYLETFIVYFFFLFTVETNFNHRFKRQLPYCSDGVSRAVAMCFRSSMSCNGGLRCESNTGYCCPVSSSRPSTSCPGGLQPIARCFNGGCNGGLMCNNGLCCRVCPFNATSSGQCASLNSCTTPNNVCNNGLCCPGCPTGVVAGVCTNGVCSVPNHACLNGVCCPSPSEKYYRTKP